MDYVGVPVFPSLPERTTTADSGNGTIYWYLNVKDITVQDYIKYLISLGYTNDTAQTKNGYYVYVKGDITVIIDTILQKGYVLVTIKTTVKISYYFHFPTVPSPNVRYEKFDRTDDGLGYVYWYTVLEKSVIESYVNILRGQGFTVTQNADYYICLYYKDYPTVPDFAVVVKDYWTVPTEYIVIDGSQYNYQIKTTGYGMYATLEQTKLVDEERRQKGDYTGNVDLYEAYIDALLSNGFTETAVPTPPPGTIIIADGTTRIFVKGNTQVSVYVGVGIVPTDVPVKTYIIIGITRN